MNQLTAKMSYDYEYLGPYNRLVVTPITDRVQLSIASAVALRQALAITGPPNAGKFETVKDYCNVSMILLLYYKFYCYIINKTFVTQIKLQ